MMGKKNILFECGKNVISIPFLSEYEKDFKSGIPLIIRAYIHEDHAHILRFDIQGAVRRNEFAITLQESNQPINNSSFLCPLCKKNIFTAINPTNLIEKMKTSKIYEHIKSDKNNEIEDQDDTVPKLDSTIVCLILHNHSDISHSLNIRMDSQGNIIYSKPILHN